MDDLSKTLASVRDGDRKATAELFQLVYDELRRIAAARLQDEPAGLTLQPTALVNEVYLRLARPGIERNWSSTGHLVAVAADVMRHVLVDNARRRKRLKRGGDQKRVDLDVERIDCGMDDDQMLALHSALEEFAQQEPLKARLVVLRFFGGMTIEEACEVLGLSRTTASRYWTFARAWLFRKVSQNSPGE